MARQSGDPYIRYAERFGRPAESVKATLREGAAPEEVARRLGLPAAAVRGPATFFADLATERAPRHVRGCGAAACLAATGGSHVAAVAGALGAEPGQAGPNGSLQEVRCLGYCYAAPAALDVDEPCAGPGLADQLLGREPRNDPPIPVVCDSPVPVVTAGLLGEEEAWAVWPRTLARGDPAVVLDQVERSGLRGRGGAGFPTARKWRAVLDRPTPRVVVVNGDEGDPGSFVDRVLMESDPHRLLEGLALACFAVGAGEAVLFVRSEYPRAQRRLREAVEEAYDAGHLGQDVHGSGFDLDVRLAAGAGSYVSGEETALLNGLEGVRGTARPRPPYPTEHGLHARPTVVNNVETLAAVPWIVRHGGDAYTRMGTSEESGTVVVSLSQGFARPGAYEVQIGVTVGHVVHLLGGGLRDGHALRALQVGGPLGGFLGPEDLDVPLSGAGLRSRGVTLGHGGVVAFDGRVSGEEVLRNLWSFIDAESCGMCSPCRVGSRRGLELAERPEGPAVAMARKQVLRSMETGSLCAFGKRVPNAVRSLARVYGLEGWGG
ncbi:MAG TPA: NADH-ubiquinone oxidoreductase-F iron-sulfur binding region domain-containing protein [Nocardioidaceae bacterium]|nr:NADH-ubiquinone oxidoreductase-F iron-sulfur binding region domain-containing protein [Nocardioidaceae bacterium]